MSDIDNKYKYNSLDQNLKLLNEFLQGDRRQCIKYYEPNISNTTIDYFKIVEPYNGNGTVVTY